MQKADLLLRNFKALRRCRMGRVRLDYMPSYFWLEPTNRCNLHCIMCPNGQGLTDGVPKGRMDMRSFRSILDQLAPHASAITLAIGGESLLHPHLCDMIAMIERRGIKTLLNTNATLLDENLAGRLLDAGLSYISFAFDGFTKPMYEKARRGADFDRTLRNILGFLRLRRACGNRKPYSVLSILRLNTGAITRVEKRRFFSRFDGLIDEIRMRDVASWGSVFKDTEQFEVRHNEGVFPPCSRLWSTMSIGWDGSVLPCIYDMKREFILGNLLEEPVERIWNNEAYRTLRSARSAEPICNACPFAKTVSFSGRLPSWGSPPA
jgi:radical SAM protein with 4Fe4S-binding SPASM domain